MNAKKLTKSSAKELKGGAAGSIDSRVVCRDMRQVNLNGLTADEIMEMLSTLRGKGKVGSNILTSNPTEKKRT